MREVNRLLSDISIPRMVRVQQHFAHEHIDREQIGPVISGILSEEKFASQIRPGMRIALPAGSREICNMDEILTSVVRFLKEKGAKPFIVPAMGSHGGATAEGQTELLKGYSITEERCGCPILASMETVLIGQTADGQDVFLDRYATEADGILVLGRVKAHTGFHGRYESGIMKMMAIGLGKQKGANACHKYGFGRMAENLELYGNAILKHAKILGAIAILENAFDQTYRLVGMSREEIPEKEPELLELSKTLMPQLLIPECDVLIVDEIGKNFSGTGMDPNVTGRAVTPYAIGGLRSQQVAVLGISDKTHGNGYGIGVANFTTQRVFRELDLDAMYINGLTCLAMNCCKIPCVFDNDRLAIQACIKMCENLGPEGPKVIRIKNTLQIEEIMISENYLDEICEMPGLSVVSEPFSMVFDNAGFLVNSKRK